LHDRVDVPDEVNAVVLRVQVRVPLEGESVSVTVPANPLAKATVIVEEAGVPATTVMLEGLAVTLNAVPIVKTTFAECDIPLLVPVIVTVKDPEVATALHVSVDVAEVVDPPRVTLVGLRPHASPVDGDTLEVSEMVPENPSSPFTVTVEDPLLPEKTSMLVGLAETVKSWTVYVIVVEWEILFPVPETWTLYNPAEPKQDRVEVPVGIVALSTTDVWDRLQDNPVAGVSNELRDTVPVKPCWPAAVMVDVPEDPASTETLVGLADIVKS
jgi:hypothetical protein